MKLVYRIILSMILPLVLTLGLWGWLSYRTMSVRIHEDTDMILRDYSEDKHRRVDDTPYGGGMGMVMTCQPIYDCFQSIRKDFAISFDYTDNCCNNGIG